MGGARLQHVVVGSTLGHAFRVVDVQAHLLDGALRLVALRGGDHLLRHRRVVQQTLVARLRRRDAKQMPVAHRELRVDVAALGRKVEVGRGERRILGRAEPRRVQHTEHRLRLRIALLRCALVVAERHLDIRDDALATQVHMPELAHRRRAVLARHAILDVSGAGERLEHRQRLVGPLPVAGRAASQLHRLLEEVGRLSHAQFRHELAQTAPRRLARGLARRAGRAAAALLRRRGRILGSRGGRGGHRLIDRHRLHVGTAAHTVAAAAAAAAAAGYARQADERRHHQPRRRSCPSCPPCTRHGECWW